MVNEWVFIDTPPNMSAVVDDAVRNATMVIIPARPGVFDVNAVQETIPDLSFGAQTLCRGDEPVAPALREGSESPIVTIAREALAKFRAPVWSGQVTNRADLLLALAHGEGAQEYIPGTRCIRDQPVVVCDRSLGQGHSRRASANGAMHKQAA